MAETDQDVVATNRRIDQIITTPVEGVSAEEIIDAREEKESLGENIRTIKSAINTDITNMAKEGNFTSVSNWRRYEVSNWYISPEGHIEITPETGAERPRIVQTIGNYDSARKIYVRAIIRSKSHSIRRI